VTNYESIVSITKELRAEESLPDKHEEFLRLFANSSTAGQNENLPNESTGNSFNNFVDPLFKVYSYF